MNNLVLANKVAEPIELCTFDPVAVKDDTARGSIFIETNSEMGAVFVEPPSNDSTAY
jgi:hypothetical protein